MSQANTGVVRAELNQKDLEQLMQVFKKAPKECRRGIQSAINTSLTQVRKSAKKAVEKRYVIGKEAVSGTALLAVRAKPSDLNARIMVVGRRYSLSDAHPGLISPTSPVNRKGMTMNQIRRIPYPDVHITKARSVAFKGGFVANGKGGFTGIFVRGKSKKFKNKTVLEAKNTLSVANMVRADEVKVQYQATAREQLAIQTPKQVLKRLEKLSK